MPLISVIMPLFNKEAYLGDAIQSVQKQTFSDWELVIVDNGSRDSSYAVANEFARADTRIKLVQFTEKQGPGSARNHGLSFALGEWVLFLDADDFLEPNHLENLLLAVEKSRAVDIVAGGWKEFETNVEETAAKWPTTYGESSRKLAENSLAFAPWAVHAAMVRRELLQKNSISWFEDLDGWPSEDTAFWFAVLQGARVAWANSAGAIYRTETPNSRNSAKNRRLWLEGLRRVINKNLHTLACFGKQPSPAQIATIVRMYECRYFEALVSHDKVVAIEFRKEALRWMQIAGWCDLGICMRKIFGIELVKNILRSFSRLKR